MVKRVQGLIVGFLLASIILSGINSFAQSIEVIFNSINISLNGIKIASIGDEYSLSNGEKVPYSILYKGTTYLPMRKIAELIGKEVEWDGNTKTATLKNTQYTSTSNNGEKFIVYSKSYKSIYLKINDVGLYTGDFEVSSFSKKNNKYYASINNVVFILNVISNSYKEEKTSNPYLKGNIVYSNDRNYTIHSEIKYSDINSQYWSCYISRSSDNKKYDFLINKDDAKSLDVINGKPIMCIDDVLVYYGYNKNSFKVEFDDVNKYIIINIANEIE